MILHMFKYIEDCLQEMEEYIELKIIRTPVSLQIFCVWQSFDLLDKNLKQIFHQACA